MRYKRKTRGYFKAMNPQTREVISVGNKVKVVGCDLHSSSLLVGKVISISGSERKVAFVHFPVGNNGKTMDTHYDITNLTKITDREYCVLEQSYVSEHIWGSKVYNTMTKLGYYLIGVFGLSTNYFCKKVEFNGKDYRWVVNRDFLGGEKLECYENETSCVGYSEIKSNQDITDLQIVFNRFKDELDEILNELKGE